MHHMNVTATLNCNYNYELYNHIYRANPKPDLAPTTPHSFSASAASASAVLVPHRFRSRRSFCRRNYRHVSTLSTPGTCHRHFMRHFESRFSLLLPAVSLVVFVVAPAPNDPCNMHFYLYMPLCAHYIYCTCIKYIVLAISIRTFAV